jgi:hypothetical protein
MGFGTAASYSLMLASFVFNKEVDLRMVKSEF